MSKYHPIDVRHPSNRPYLHRNYLLDAPTRGPASSSGNSARPAPAATTRTAAAASAVTRALGTRRSGMDPREVAAPWSTPNAATTTQRAQRGGLGFFRSLVIFAVIVFVVSRNSDILDPVLGQLRLWALRMGFELPF